jgi:hypothetical protein
MSPKKKGYEYHSTFTSDDLRAFHKFLMERGGHLAMEEKKEEEGSLLLKMARQIEVIHFNALIFEDIIRLYAGDLEVNFDLAMMPLEEIPLHINDQDVGTRAIMEWRLKQVGK